MSSKNLTIVGAGPKSIAIAAKASLLSQLGFDVPTIQIIENRKVAAHWLPETGYTNGRVKLGTMPETDLGFPYDSSTWSQSINHQINRLMQRYSWQNYLISEKNFSYWVDRGRPAPDHSHWASYLYWVLNQVLKESPFIKLQYADFQRFDFSANGGWIVITQDKQNQVNSFETDGIVLTGPGEIRRPQHFPSHPRVLDVESFWRNIHEFEKFSETSKIAIIGNGESAATIAMVVGELSVSIQEIDLITPIATNYSRGESFSECLMYTDPVKGGWFELTLEDRRDFIDRTDHGVFSLAAKQKLDKMENINTIHGIVTGVSVHLDNKIALEVDYNSAHKTRIYDAVIFAMGFDPVKFITLKTTEQTRQEIVRKTQIKVWNTDNIEQSIDTDLSLRNLFPKLHLPMLAAVQQGPGFPGLCCLGRLSDQILSSWVSSPK